MASARLNVTLDPERAAKLAMLAERAHVNDGTLARSMLSAAIDDADPDARVVTDILEGIPGLADRLQHAADQVAHGEVIDLEDL
jgi:hypothetical protein